MSHFIIGIATPENGVEESASVTGMEEAGDVFSEYVEYLEKRYPDGVLFIRRG